MEFKYYAALSEKIAALQNPARLQLNELLNEITVEEDNLAWDERLMQGLEEDDEAAFAEWDTRDTELTTLKNQLLTLKQQKKRLRNKTEDVFLLFNIIV